MLQVVAAVTVAFVGYVLYEVFKTVSRSGEQPAAGAEAVRTKAAEPAKPAVTAAAQRAAEAETEEKGPQLRNPATGETCPIPTNYRFARKWVKEALVAEKLLDRVYKTADLDDKITQKTKVALEKLKVMEKYQA